MTPEKTEEIINLFATSFKLSVQHPEPNIYYIEGFELYLPGHNTIFDEELTVFLVCAGVTIPGCRTMPNGDPGYPDDYDTVEVGQFGALLNALEKIGHCIMTQWVDEIGLMVAHTEEPVD